MDKKKSKEVRIKFVEDLKVDYKIEPLKLRRSRAEEKTETRKMKEKWEEER